MRLQDGIDAIHKAFEEFGFCASRGNEDGATRVEEALIADLSGEWGLEFARALQDASRSLAAPPEDLQLRSPPTEARCRCCNRRLTDTTSIAAGEGPLCREGRCRKKAG